MSEDYIEIIDYKKIMIVLIPIVIAGIAVSLFALGIINLETLEFSIPEISMPSIEPPITINPAIDENYQKFLDFGLNENEILFYQYYDCAIIEFQNHTLSDEGIFGAIFTQKLIECGLD